MSLSKTSKREKFKEWLQQKDYWVNQKEIEEEFGAEYFEEFSLEGITVKEDEEGNWLIPKRDLRKGVP